MRRLPWHVSLRADRRALLTSLGIALGVAFSVVGFTLATGLEGEAISAEGRFAFPDVLIGRDGELFLATEVEGDALLHVLLVEGIDARGKPLLLAGVSGPRAPLVAADDARPGPEAPASGAIELVSPAFANLTLGAPVDDPLLGADWLLVEPQQLRELAGIEEGLVSYVLLPPMDADARAALEDRGFSVTRVPGVEPFYGASAIEVARTLLLLVVFSSILVGLFTYEFLRTEIRERRREIGLWRSVGMRVRDVTILLVARGAFIAAMGAAVGFLLALGALGAAARVVGSGVFDTLPSLATCALLLLAFLLAGIVGAALPALAESRRPVREWLEALV